MLVLASATGNANMKNDLLLQVVVLEMAQYLPSEKIEYRIT